MSVGTSVTIYSYGDPKVIVSREISSNDEPWYRCCIAEFTLNIFNQKVMEQLVEQLTAALNPVSEAPPVEFSPEDALPASLEDLA